MKVSAELFQEPESATSKPAGIYDAIKAGGIFYRSVELIKPRPPLRR